MSPGPWESRLKQYDGGQVGRVRSAEAIWRRGGRALADVAERLRQVADEVTSEGMGGQTATSARTAFVAVSATARDGSDKFDRGSQAMGIAAAALNSAQTTSRAMGGVPAAPASSPAPPDATPRETVQHERQHASALRAHQSMLAQREETARHQVTTTEAEYAEATRILMEISGYREDDDAGGQAGGSGDSAGGVPVRGGSAGGSGSGAFPVPAGSAGGPGGGSAHEVAPVGQAPVTAPAESGAPAGGGTGPTPDAPAASGGGLGFPQGGGTGPARRARPRPAPERGPPGGPPAPPPPSAGWPPGPRAPGWSGPPAGSPPQRGRPGGGPAAHLRAASAPRHGRARPAPWGRPRSQGPASPGAPGPDRRRPGPGPRAAVLRRRGRPDGVPVDGPARVREVVRREVERARRGRPGAGPQRAAVPPAPAPAGPVARGTRRLAGARSSRTNATGSTTRTPGRACSTDGDRAALGRTGPGGSMTAGLGARPRDDQTATTGGANSMTQVPSTSGLLRVTVASGTRRVDLVVPGAVPVAELVPELARSVGLLDGATVYGGYHLLSQDGRELGNDSGLIVQGVEDGGLLTVTAGIDDEAPRVYDDVVEAMTDVVERDLKPWQPASGRRTALVAAALLLALGAGALLSRPSTVSALAAAVVAAVLVTGAVVLSRAQAETEAAAVVGWLGAGYAAAAGLAMPVPMPASGLLAGLPVDVAGLGALLAGLVCLVGVRDGRALAVPPVVVGAVLLGAGLLVRFTSFDPAVVLSVVLVVVVVAGSVLPWLALSATGTTVDQMYSAADVTADPEDIDADQVGADARTAHEILLAVSGTVGVLLLLLGPVAVSLGLAGTLLAVTCCLVVMLRTRQYRTGAAVLVGLGSGVLGLAATAAAALWLHPEWRSTAALVLAVAGAVLLALTLVPATPSVRRGRLGDLLESVALVALLPLLVVATGAFAAVQGS